MIRGKALQTTVTGLLQKVGRGNRQALDELFPIVYDELRARAQQVRRKWRGDYTLNTSALINEAYLKLTNQDEIEWGSKAHFLTAAAQAMRHILIDYARQKAAQKRGGDQIHVTLEEMGNKEPHSFELSDKMATQLLALEEALKKLEEFDQRSSRIVTYRFFGGLTVKETAAALGISSATVKRDWALAQAWLYKEMEQSINQD